MTLLKVNEPEWKQLHRIADGLAPEVSRELFTALDSLKGQIPTGSLIDLIEDGRLAEVLAAVKLEMPDLTALQNAIGQIVSQSGTRAISQVENLFPLRFDLVNPEAVSVIGSERWAQEYGRIGEKTNQLIQGVNEETQKAVNDIVQRGFLEGTAPRVQALQIESMIGLTNRDGLAVSKYLKGLTDSGISERRARDLAGTYHDRLLRRRAQMIARTETMRAANLGQQLAWENATDLGLLLPGEVQKIWIVTDDDRTCARCLTLEDAQVDLGMSFTEGAKEDRPDVPPPPSKNLKPQAIRKGAEQTTTLTPPLHVGCRCAMGLVELPEPEEAPTVVEAAPVEPAPVVEAPKPKPKPKPKKPAAAKPKPKPVDKPGGHTSRKNPLKPRQWDQLDPKQKFSLRREIERDWRTKDSKNLRDFIFRWTGSDTGLTKLPTKNAVKNLRKDLADVLKGLKVNTPGREQAEVALRALRTSPHKAPAKLFRGSARAGNIDDVFEGFADLVDTEMDLRFSSFSGDRKVMNQFAKDTAEGIDGEATRVFWEWAGQDKQALPIAPASVFGGVESEWLAGGQFRISSVKKMANGVKVILEQTMGL